MLLHLESKATQCILLLFDLHPQHPNPPSKTRSSWLFGILVFALEHLDRGLSGRTNTDVLYSDAEEVLDELAVRLALGREIGPGLAVCDV
jgi:hypothetical protein